MQVSNLVPLYWDERDHYRVPQRTVEEPRTAKPKLNKTVIQIDLSDYEYDDEEDPVDSYINVDGTIPIREEKYPAYAVDFSDLYRDKEPIRVRPYETVDMNKIPPILMSKLESIDDVGSKGLAYTIVSDPRRGYVSSTGVYRDTFNNVVTLKGITTGLRETFWPDFDFSKIKRSKPKTTNNTNSISGGGGGGGVEKKGKKKRYNKLSSIAKPEDFIKIQNFKTNTHKMDILNEKYR